MKRIPYSPKSKGRADVVKEEAEAVKAGDHPEVVKALQKLIEQLKAQGAGGEAVAGIRLDISGGTQQGIIGAGSVSGTTLNFGKA